METIKNIKNNLFNTQVGVASMMFGIAIIICAIVLGQGIGNIKRANNVISVTGSTEKIVKSDTAKVVLSISRKSTANSADIVTQNRSLNEDTKTVKEYLLKSGIKEEEIDVSQVKTVDICVINQKSGYSDCQIGVTGHDMSVEITVNTKNVKLATSISGAAVSDLSIKVNSVNLNRIEYYYDNLKNDRVDMLAEATKNATERANAIAIAGNSKLGSIVEASSGVFQVTTVNSSDVSDYGSYDTSSIDKKVTAVVRVSFEVK